MNYRSTSTSFSSQAVRFVGRYTSSIANYQKQISSGLRLHRPSDDPIAFRKSTSLTARLEQLRTQTASINDTKAKLNISVSTITDANDLITSAKVLTQQGVQALSDAERNALAVEAESLLQSMKDITNTKVAGEYLYSGTKTDVRPFTFGNPTVEGGPLQSTYTGSSQHSRAYVGESVSLDTFYPGNEVFAGSGRKESVLMGKTGAQLGAGTDNLIGRATLQIRHTATTYAAGSGISAGSSSASKDTVIGTLGQNSVTINDTSGDGSAGTISLNGGAAIAFSNTDANLEVTGANGKKIFVNMTAITPGFSGNVDLEGQGTMSVDGGLTTVPIDFSDSQTITDSTTGRFVHIDSQAITKPGDDYLEFPGTSNVIQTLHELVQDLRNTRNLSNSDLGAALDRRLAELGAASDHLLDAMGHQAASLQTLQTLDYRLQDLELETEEQLNNVQATDIAEAVLRMQNDQSLLEYTYAITAEITSVGLINFLR